MSNKIVDIVKKKSFSNSEIFPTIFIDGNIEYLSLSQVEEKLNEIKEIDDGKSSLLHAVVLSLLAAKKISKINFPDTFYDFLSKLQIKESSYKVIYTMSPDMGRSNLNKMSGLFFDHVEPSERDDAFKIRQILKSILFLNNRYFNSFQYKVGKSLQEELEFLIEDIKKQHQGKDLGKPCWIEKNVSVLGVLTGCFYESNGKPDENVFPFIFRKVTPKIGYSIISPWRYEVVCDKEEDKIYKKKKIINEIIDSLNFNSKSKTSVLKRKVSKICAIKHLDGIPYSEILDTLWEILTNERKNYSFRDKLVLYNSMREYYEVRVEPSIGKFKTYENNIYINILKELLEINLLNYDNLIVSLRYPNSESIRKVLSIKIRNRKIIIGKIDYINSVSDLFGEKEISNDNIKNCVYKCLYPYAPKMWNYYLLKRIYQRKTEDYIKFEQFKISELQKEPHYLLEKVELTQDNIDKCFHLYDEKYKRQIMGKVASNG